MEVSSMLKALGEPTRASIYQLLIERKHCVRSLSKKLGITESAVSQHMKVLREAGLVYGEQFGYHTHYLPKQEALSFLICEFQRMQRKSLERCSDAGTCECEFRKESERA